MYSPALGMPSSRRSATHLAAARATVSASLAAALAVAAALGACKKNNEETEGPANASVDASADVGVDAGEPLEWDASVDGGYDARAEEEALALEDAGRFCGGDAGDAALPDCPLQGWMKRHASPPILSGDIAQIADVFFKTEPLDPRIRLPDGGVPFRYWRSICEDGASAARSGEVEAAKAACRGCHTLYRNAYHRQMRARPIADPYLVAPDAGDTSR
jgi:hypothetical protein